MGIEAMSPASGRMIGDNDKVVNIIETVTGGLLTTESDHTANHRGYGYKTHLSITNLAAGQSLSWCWTGPHTLFAHLKNFSLMALGSSCKLELLTGADVTVNTGTAVSLINTNHNSDRTAQSTLKAAPTYSGGTMWDQVMALVDSTNQVVGISSFQASPYEELITKDGDTNYIFKVTNIGSDLLQSAWIKIFFYEEPIGIIE